MTMLSPTKLVLADDKLNCYTGGRRVYRTGRKQLFAENSTNGDTQQAAAPADSTTTIRQ